MARELMPLPSEREMDMLLATGEQTTIALDRTLRLARQ